MLTKKQLPTPALLMDLDAMEANLTRMADRVKQCGKKLRPHAKAHKCVDIAKRQIAAGATGISVATLAEAELLSKAGIPNLLLTSPVADPLKIARIVQTGAMVAVDHVQQAAWYEEAAAKARRTVDVLIDLDVGDHRTGARSTEQALDIAQAVDRAAHLRLKGLQGYSGRASHAGDFAERKKVSEHAFSGAIATQSAMKHAGLSIEILSGGSTGTWDIDLALPEVTELQAGSYVFMDLDYRRVGADFRHSLTVLATVISANHEGFVTVDAGLKAFATDRGYGPEAANLPGAGYRWGGDEFGYVDLNGSAAKPRLGDRIEFIPPHCDPTVNLYDRIHACRGDNVEAIWPIMARVQGPLV
ncbi:MAG TPA: DSD1 family PLP-dependent enzyme [Bryobacteraceae bacterium]|nr:DSD1 family PLP-dependent enzyme [Bryobacteraceae bacterium]